MMTTTSSEPAPGMAQPPAPVVPGTGALTPLGVDQVRLAGGFWGSWQEVNATGILPHADAWEERVGWVENFRRAAAGTLPHGRTGREFADSDVYKLLEAMAWEYGRTGQAWLDERIREVGALLVAAQEPDGYLHTLYGREGQEPRYSDWRGGTSCTTTATSSRLPSRGCAPGCTTTWWTSRCGPPTTW